MEQRIVSQEQTKYIYWIKEKDNEFYLTIPQSKKVSLVLNMINRIDDNIIKEIKEIKEKVIITPIIKQEIIDGIKQNSAEAFGKVDEILSNILNLSHKILTYNHLEVENYVYINENNEYTMFNTWFVKKYEGRVSLIKLEQQKEQQIVKEPLFTTNTLEDTTPEINKKEQKPVQITETEDFSNHLEPERKDMGFVSYVLLGVVVAIASLILLYFII